MTHSSYKNGALKEAHCTMNKQIGVKNTETLTRYHEKRQGKGIGWERRATNTGVRQLKRGFTWGNGGKAGVLQGLFNFWMPLGLL